MTDPGTGGIVPGDPVRVALLDDYQGAALSCADWASLGERVEVTAHRDHLDDQDALVERLAGCDVVVAMRERTPFPAALLARLPRLRLLVTTGMQNSSIDVAAATAQGVTVCGTGLSGPGTVETTWALLLAVARDVPGEDAAVRAGQWQRGLPVELHGRTLGVLGLGRLGSQVAAIGRAFGMRVVAWSRSLTAAAAAEAGAELAGSLDELCAAADFLTVHVPLTDASRGLLGAAQLDRLGPRGRLVNTSRGPIVDEAALVAALHEGRIAGAALDVFDTEPLPVGHALLSTPNTVLSPHLGFVSGNAYRIAYGDAVADIAGWLAGRPVRVVPP
jgi:phosphoglycerate dehydrogenase-like enzyme